MLIGNAFAYEHGIIKEIKGEKKIDPVDKNSYYEVY